MVVASVGRLVGIGLRHERRHAAPAMGDLFHAGLKVKAWSAASIPIAGAKLISNLSRPPGFGVGGDDVYADGDHPAHDLEHERLVEGVADGGEHCTPEDRLSGSAVYQ